jgi:RNA polymerase primary sigma factor
LVTPQEEVSLAKRIARGDNEARDRLIKANLRLVVKIAHGFEGLGLPLLDLVGEGCVGLVKAAERFDPKKGAKFSTYAAWWIKRSIRAAISRQARTVRLPVYVVARIASIRRVESRALAETKLKPDDEGVAAELGLTVQQVRQCRRAEPQSTSLDAPLRVGSSLCLTDTVPNENARDPFVEVARKQDRAMLGRLMNSLSGRQREILHQRFGLNGEDKKTLHQIGKQFGLTRERIRQLEAAALKKLRQLAQRLGRSQVPPRKDSANVN